jgi:hypothetical protein
LPEDWAGPTMSVISPLCLSRSWQTRFAEAAKLDEQEGPQREAARQKKQLDDAQRSHSLCKNGTRRCLNTERAPNQSPGLEATMAGLEVIGFASRAQPAHLRFVSIVKSKRFSPHPRPDNSPFLTRMESWRRTTKVRGLMQAPAHKPRNSAESKSQTGKIRPTQSCFRPPGVELTKARN